MNASLYSLKMARLTDLVKDSKDDIVDGPFGSRLKASEYVGEGIPIVRLQNIDRNRFIDKNIKFVTAEKAKGIARHHFVAGDILVSKLGDPLGEACIAPDHLPYGILVADVVRIRPNREKVDTPFLSYALNSASVVSQFTAETKGTTRPRVNLKKIRELQIPIAESLPVQRRIVAEIEKQFTRLEAGVTALERVQAGLRRYRAAVLKAACEGKLVPTEAELQSSEARSRMPAPPFETGDALLARILAERRKNWQDRGQYREAAAPNAGDLPPLPKGWTWATVEQTAAATVDCPHSTPKWTDRGRVCVRTTEFRPGLLDLSEVRFVSEEAFQERISRIEPREGDILYSREGGILGIACQIPEGVSLCLGQRMMLIRPSIGVIARFVMDWLNSPMIVNRVKSLTSGSASPHLNVGDIRQFPIPLPPLVEQTRIVAEVERRLSVIDELEAVVSANLQRAGRLRQAILQKAFTGRLSRSPGR